MNRAVLLRTGRRLTAALLVAGLAGCGYALVGRGGGFPQGVATVAVASFRNRTERYGLESQMSASLVQQVLNTGKVKVGPLGDADAHFEGIITGYASDPIAYTAQRVITQRRVTVTATVEFKVKGEKAPFFSEQGLTGRAEFSVTGNLSRDADSEKAAAAKAIEELAEKAVSTVVEGF